MSVLYAPHQAALVATTALCGVSCMIAYLLAFAVGRRVHPLLSRPVIGLGELIKPLAGGMLLGTALLCFRLDGDPAALARGGMPVGASPAVLLFGVLLSVGFAGICAGVWNARPVADRAQASATDLVHRLCVAGGDANRGANQEATARIALRLALAAGYDPAGAADLMAAVALHDIGKTGIPDLVLKKAAIRAVLDPAEQRLLRNHTRIGFRMLAHSREPMLELAADIALHHHENWDGTGYPHGLAGDAIPISSRVVALAERFDEILAVPTEIDELVRSIRRHAGTQFDPNLVDLLLDDLPGMIAARGAKVPARKAAAAASPPADEFHAFGAKHIAI